MPAGGKEFQDAGAAQLKDRLPMSVYVRTAHRTRKPCYRMDALKNLGSPWLRLRLLFPKLSSVFVAIDRMKFDVRSFLRSWDNGGDILKHWAIQLIRPRALFSNILMGFCLDGPCECTVSASRGNTFTQKMHWCSFMDNYLENIQLTWFRSIRWFLAHDDLWDWLWKKQY